MDFLIPFDLSGLVILSSTLFLGIKLKEKALTRTLLQIKFILFKLENSVAVNLDRIMIRIIVFFSLENDSSFCIIFIFLLSNLA